MKEQLNYIIYNTGDQIWYKLFNNKMIVYKLITHDGITWIKDDE